MAANFPTAQLRTLTDITQQDYEENQTPEGQYIGNVINVLATTNKILQDIPFLPANYGMDKFWHKIVTSYPKTYWARYGRGIPPSKGTFASVEETSGKLKSTCQVEKEMADDRSGGNAGARYQLILDQEKLHMEALAQDMAHHLFYGDKKVTPEAFDGLAVRYSSLSPDEPSSKNIIDCGGTGNNLTSIWLIAWGDGCHGFYPKFGQAGVTAKHSTQFLPDPDGYPIEYYHTEFKWQIGLAIPDWRKVVRLVNIDVDQLMSGQGIGQPDLSKPGNNNLIMRLNQARSLLDNVRKPSDRVFWYGNNDVQSALSALALRENSKVVRFEQTTNALGSVPDLNAFGITFRQTDALSSQENRLTV